MDYITELYYGDYITESDHRIILRNYITGSCYGIMLPNDIMELYSKIALLRRIEVIVLQAQTIVVSVIPIWQLEIPMTNMMPST